MTADWQLPPGTDRGVWDYVTSVPLARGYDAALAGTPLLSADLAFCDRQYPTPGRLVDLGCGTGRLIFHFARRGYPCVGVDLSDAMLDVLGEKAVELPVFRIKANLVELDGLADASFDYAACLFSTFGMIRGRDNRVQFLRHVRRMLRPGGRLVVHVHNRWYRFGRGSGKAGPEPGDRTMPQHYAGAELTLHHFTRREALGLLAAAGFRVTAVEAVGVAGPLPAPWRLRSVRAYGYLIAAE